MIESDDVDMVVNEFEESLILEKEELGNDKDYLENENEKIEEVTNGIADLLKKSFGNEAYFYFQNMKENVDKKLRNKNIKKTNSFFFKKYHNNLITSYYNATSIENKIQILSLIPFDIFKYIDITEAMPGVTKNHLKKARKISREKKGLTIEKEKLFRNN